MGLKKYRIDTGSLAPEEQDKAIQFIENNAYNHKYIPNTKGEYVCFWEEAVNPSVFPVLSGCMIEELP